MATTPGNRLCEEFSELRDGHRAQVSTFTCTHSDSLHLDFPISDNQEIGNLEQSMLADFKADLFISQVGLGTKSALIESFFNFSSKIGLFISDIHDHCLSRRQPRRERTFVVLDQDTDEPFERSKDRAVQHNRVLAAVVFGDIFGSKTDRQVEIELQGTTLPDTTQTIFQRKLNLRTVEGAFTRLQIVRRPALSSAEANAAFGAIPQLIGTHALFRTSGQLQLDVLEAEVA
jgi:hypothetical protein